MKWAFPTVCLSVDIREDPRGEEWLLQRTVMNDCHNGKYQLDVQIINERGKLVATSQHACLIIARTADRAMKM